MICTVSSGALNSTHSLIRLLTHSRSYRFRSSQLASYVRLFFVAVGLDHCQRFTSTVGRLHQKSLVTVRVGDPASHLRQEAEMMPAPGVSVVEVDATPMDEVAFHWPVRGDWPQRVDEHPRGHVRTAGAV